ncbi:HAD family hydrolase [Vibrio sp. 10N.286.49.B3]|uniref:Cof-type HAD-IIB family hydrolase n=1 Tax=Vibrio sp. 10N.286.49.B3 TaxID=1880855 RepID=UPI000C8473E5|nr:Cof-type HAD-IIB family hydrolase [Vibrio sp. 10N.286.49.B3]PMH44915.1 HAD family hydrolase [Vibrio sp. 10N.286.49.B3]
MYKLIALDMDGTLLTSQKNISAPTKEAIKKAKELGVTVVLASGRPLEGMQSKLDELNINTDQDFVLYYNGSMVKNVATDEIIHSKITDGKAAKKIAQLADKLDVNVHAFSQVHGLITPKNSEYTELEAKINGLTIKEFDFSTLEDDHPIIKTMIVAKPERLTQALSSIPAEFYQQFTIVQSAPFFLEFLNTESNKGVGIKAIAEHLGIKQEEVICVGDAENDHHMLKYAGLSIAMDNATAETKAIADHITTSNDDHGVARAIEQFILTV